MGSEHSLSAAKDVAAGPVVAPATEHGGVSSGALHAAAGVVLNRELAGTEAEPVRDEKVKVPDAPGRLRLEQAQARDVGQLQGQYGAAPRKYRTVLSAPTTPRERKFVEALPRVVRLINQALEQERSPVRVTEAEIAVNFLSEGGILDLRGLKEDDAPIHAVSVGADTLVDRYQSLRHLLPASLRERIESGKHTIEFTNEKREKVHTLGELSFDESIHANAAMFAQARAMLQVDLAGMNIAWVSLPPRTQFYWTTVYFNAGEVIGKKRIEKHGIGQAERPWAEGDDSVKYGGNPIYNATWRTATWDLVSGGSGRTTTGITPLPPVGIERKQFYADVDRAYEESCLPVARGEQPIMRARRWLDLVGAFSQLPPGDEHLAYYMRVTEKLRGLFGNVASLNEASAKPYTQELYAILKKPVPDWSGLSLGAIAAEIEKVTAAPEVQSPRFENSREIVAAVGRVLASRLGELSSTLAERGSR